MRLIKNENKAETILAYAMGFFVICIIVSAVLGIIGIL